MPRERRNRFYLHTAGLSASVIVSCMPYVAPHIQCNMHVPFYLRLECMFLPALYLPISAWLQPNRVDQFMWRRIVPYGAHLDNQGYLMRPWGRWRQGGVRKEGRRESTYRSWRGRKMRVGNRRRKTMRQNQKINEALFQWQDLCTVNITLAIRGNPITLRLSSPFSLGGGEIREQKSEGWRENGYRERERTRTPLRDLSNFQHIFRY